ncbi:feruloyl esterase B [Colletotrichum scovillei]|uniref:feruloyl esterase B n=1 Tax=Colletotrichum scovillei TaxID=1209932 RepID=UPI0015C3351A|nr:feruloyl esterase B [Colletotrichum scovillei]KAF4781259.1 feruloyl esterase B [Colletotrichum scovillei]KAG7052410.1 feruloyl esterase B [Colletotrichum scovillei]
MRLHLAWAAALLPILATAASLQHITTDFGPNPTNVSFYLYVPDSLIPNAPLLVFPHWCHGNATDAFNYKPWRPLADTLGFVTIYPSTPHTADYCWDVSSPQTLSHDAGGDSLGIVSMVRWTLQNYDVDADRVFVTGVSSGAMMTNVLVGAYPDVFAAGSAFAGVPFGCYAADGFAVWSDDCASGRITHTGEEWAAIVEAAYPGYAGPRPKLQVLHGDVDNVLNVTNFYEEIKMWTTVLGTGATPTEVVEDDPVAGWTKSVYGTKGLFEAFLAHGIDHNIPDQADEVIRFFDLDCVGENCFSRKSLPVSGTCAKRRRSSKVY